MGEQSHQRGWVKRMSAIVGVIQYGEQPVDTASGHIMMEQLQRKYNFDDVREWVDGQVYFGSLVQWVTPESVHEHLPIYHPELRLAITADVILDNRVELCDLLQVDYERRRHIGDGELLLLAYAKWQDRCVDYFLGDYAFLIWDENNHRLFGARDLSGNRTLYYHTDRKGKWMFSSAIKPLLTIPGIKAKINEQWLAEFMAIIGMYECSDSSMTAYENIRQLPPAHTIVITDDRLHIARYGEQPVETLHLRSNEEYEEAFRSVFQQAVRSKLRTHKQVGVTLSGGLDSGSVAGFAAPILQEQGKRLHSYSYVPADDFIDYTGKHSAADERPYISETVKHVGNIDANYLSLSGYSPLSIVDGFLDTMEIPYKYFENSFWIKGVYEQAKQDGVGVLLTGGRGNYTVSFGPAIDYYARLMRAFRWSLLMRELHSYSRAVGVGRSNLVRVIGKRAFPYMIGVNGSAMKEDWPRLIDPQFASQSRVYESLEERGISLYETMGHDMIEARMNILHNLAVINKNGSAASKLSLKYGIREGDPTGDWRVIRFCLSLPMDQYVQNGMDRAMIRRATAGYLPDRIRLNQRIRGTQGADWLHRMLPHWPKFKAELLRMCSLEQVKRYVHTSEITNILTQYGDQPDPEHAFNPSMRYLVRGYIVSRFIELHT